MARPLSRRIGSPVRAREKTFYIFLLLYYDPAEIMSNALTLERLRQPMQAKQISSWPTISSQPTMSSPLMGRREFDTVVRLYC
jgi:hypothetical protein